MQKLNKKSKDDLIRLECLYCKSLLSKAKPLASGASKVKIECYCRKCKNFSYFVF